MKDPIENTVHHFFAEVLQDNDLVDRFVEAMQQDSFTPLAELAWERGYEFTEEEMNKGLARIYEILPKPSDP